MSGHNPFEHMNDPFKRRLRAAVQEHLPPEMQASDAAITNSAMVKAIRAMESHDPEVLAELRQQADVARAAAAAKEKAELTPAAALDAVRHMDGEELWFHLNGQKLVDAALARRAAQAPADPRDVLSETIAMRREGLDVDGEGHGRPRLVGGVAPRAAAEPLGRVNETGNGAIRQ